MEKSCERVDEFAALPPIALSWYPNSAVQYFDQPTVMPWMTHAKTGAAAAAMNVSADRHRNPASTTIARPTMTPSMPDCFMVSASPANNPAPASQASEAERRHQ